MDDAVIQPVRLSVKPGLPPRGMVGIVVLAALTVLLTWRAHVLEKTLESESEQPALVGQTAPDFSGFTMDGRPVSLADFRGQKKVVVSFWASWCGPCRMEMPALVKFYKDHHTDSSDFELLAVSIDEDPKAAADFAGAEKLNFPIVLDPSHKMADAYQVDGIPTMFVIDKDGKIIYGHEGYDLTMEFSLMAHLGIKPKTQGGPDGDPSH